MLYMSSYVQRQCESESVYLSQCVCIHGEGACKQKQPENNPYIDVNHELRADAEIVLDPVH